MKTRDCTVDHPKRLPWGIALIAAFLVLMALPGRARAEELPPQCVLLGGEPVGVAFDPSPVEAYGRYLDLLNPVGSAWPRVFRRFRFPDSIREFDADDGRAFVVTADSEEVAQAHLVDLSAPSGEGVVPLPTGGEADVALALSGPFLWRAGRDGTVRIERWEAGDAPRPTDSFVVGEGWSVTEIVADGRLAVVNLRNDGGTELRSMVVALDASGRLIDRQYLGFGRATLRGTDIVLHEQRNIRLFNATFSAPGRIVESRFFVPNRAARGGDTILAYGLVGETLWILWRFETFIRVGGFLGSYALDDGRELGRLVAPGLRDVRSPHIHDAGGVAAIVGADGLYSFGDGHGVPQRGWVWPLTGGPRCSLALPWGYSR